MSLTEVEVASSGEFKASVLGAYERGDRALSVRRLVRLAQLYDIHPGQLLPDVDNSAGEAAVTIDLDQLTSESELVDRFMEAVRLMRTDSRGPTVRQSDLALLSSMVAASPVPAPDDTEG